MGCSGCDWDPQKEIINWRKHRIRFADACCVFNDPNLETWEDTGDYDEFRWIALGRVGLIIMYVVYTERHGAERIISARKAAPHEEQRYYGRFTQQKRT